MEERIRDLFRRYTEGKVTEQESKAVDQVFDQAQQEGLSEQRITGDRLLKLRLDQKIFEQTIYKTNTKRRVLLAAASTLLIICSALFILHQAGFGTVQVIAQNGQKLQVRLPDASVAYLNSGSELRYFKWMEWLPNREIKLTGEAYFEVTHNPEKPFIVKSTNLNTLVLGTRFVVDDYPGEEPSVTVRSGKVGVSTKTGEELAILEMNQQIIYANPKISFTQVDATDYYSWKDGKIVFVDADLKEVAITLQRRFGAEVRLNADNHESCTISGSYYDNNLDDVLNSLEFIYGIKHTSDKEGVIQLTAKSCN